MNQNLLNPNNTSGLSLMALGLLAMHGLGIPREQVESSNVDFEHALDELVRKKRVQMKPVSSSS